MAAQKNNSSANSSMVIELRDVDRDFFMKGSQATPTSPSQFKLQALSRVSLKLQAGEFVFLTGPSGAGKTTLLRLLLGLDRPTSGQVFTLGQAVHQLNEAGCRNLRRQVGIVFQDHRLLSSLNVYENVELPLCFMGLGENEKSKRVMEILEALQMRDFAWASIGSLSAGEKQRVAIARALVTCPALIIADEPTGNLDPVAARSLIRLLRELKGHGTTVLIATHDMSLVRDFGGRVLELVSGSMPIASPFSKAYKVPQFWNQNTRGVNL